VKSLEKLSAEKIGILQGGAVATYISLIGVIFSNAGNWLPDKNPLMPILFLSLFAVSVLICGFLALGYPIYLFFIVKRKPEAIKVVAVTTLTLIIFLVLVFLAIVLV
jgi:hypothetical protein